MFKNLFNRKAVKSESISNLREQLLESNDKLKELECKYKSLKRTMDLHHDQNNYGLLISLENVISIERIDIGDDVRTVVTYCINNKFIEWNFYISSKMHNELVKRADSILNINPSIITFLPDETTDKEV